MSTQSYYKDLLGFDPREVYESSGGSNGGGGGGGGGAGSGGQSTTIKSGSRTSRIVQHHHYSSHSGSSSPQHQQHSNGLYHGSPSKKLKHSEYTSSTTIRSAHSASPGAQIGASIATTNSNIQGDGYEDALTQFKGTMSIWDYFVENWDVTGTSANANNTIFAWFCYVFC